MKIRTGLTISAIFGVTCSALLGQYSYFFTDYLTTISSSWTQNGIVSGSPGGLTSSDQYGGSLISNGANGNNYEVKTTLTLANSGGVYVTYLRASPHAQSGHNLAGTSYALEVQTPTFSNGPGSACTATFAAYSIVSGVLTQIGSTPIVCNDGMTVRAVITSNNRITVYINNIYVWSVLDTSISGGQPGIGVRRVPTGNSIKEVDFGAIYSGTPTMPPVSQIGTTVFASTVEIQWPGASEDPGGPGVAFYSIYRNGAYLAQVGLASTNQGFEDTSLSPSTSYTYTIEAFDYDLNRSLDTIMVTTPPAGSTDPRQIGVRPTGSYWGGAGEQIDMRSGNLNYTIPLVNAMGRGNWSVSFNLVYNSQNWRQDPGGTWQLGEDVGYGYGWKLLAGSLLPFYTPSGIGEYIYTDSTGAQYHLNQNNGGVFTSTKSYVSFDSSSGKLYFNDGSVWVMGAISAGTEWDAGTMYPTQMEDSNGNEILITYHTGLGASWNDSSSRISKIEDVRGLGSNDYTFSYNSDSIPHLIGITNTIGTSENYTFAYNEGYALTSPFSTTSFGTVTLLESSGVTGLQSTPLTTYLTYDNYSATNSCGSSGTGTSGSGQLTEVTTPYCGHLRWIYTNSNTLSGSRAYNEVQTRYLSMFSGATETAIQLIRANDSSYTVHSSATLDDSPANAEKYWSFQTTSSQFSLGLQLSYEERTLSTHVPLSHLDFTWAQTPVISNPYIGTTVTRLDPGQAYETDKETDQTLDQYGNIIQVVVKNFGTTAPGSVARTYTNQYLTGSSYSLAHIFNRLKTSSVTDGTNSAILVSNTFDSTAITSVTGLHEHDDTNYPATFTSRGNVTNSVTPTTTVTSVYDMAGNLVSAVSNWGNTSVTTGPSTNYAAPTQVTTNALTSTLSWNGFLGLNSAAGPNGDTASTIYNTGNARPQNTTSPLGAVTNYTYNDTASPPNIVATTNGHWVKTVRDGFGRTIQTVTGYGTTTNSIVDVQYAPCGCSSLGKLSQQSQPYVSGTEVWTVYHYDASGRTTSVVLPDASATIYMYLGNNVSVTDPAGIWKQFIMDTFNNIQTVWEADPLLFLVHTDYTYDVLNHLTVVSMPRGTNITQSRTFNYNIGTTVMGFLQSASNPENGTINYTYNGNNLLGSKTDQAGQNFTYQYDTSNRITSITWANAPGGSKVLRSFIYDTNTLDGSFSGNYTQGRLVAVQNAKFTPGNGSVFSSIQLVEMYAYTQAGQVNGKRLQLQEQLPSGGALLFRNLDALYGYDAQGEGKIQALTYPTTFNVTGPNQLTATAGPTYYYSYDSMSRPLKMNDYFGNLLINSTAYDAANRLLSFSYFQGGSQVGTETRQYNSLEQLIQLTTYGGNSYTYNYTAGANNGKIASAVVSGETISYQYDALNRLYSAAGSGWGETYGYDSFGNLLTKNQTLGTPPSLSQAVNSANNQIVGQNYDMNGNQLTAPGVTGSLTYDAENRMIAAPGIQYAYDSQNARVWGGTLDSNGNLLSQTVYSYGVDGQKLGAYSVSLATSGSTLALADPPTETEAYFVGKRVAITNASGQTWFSQDRLGSNAKTNIQLYPWGEDRGTVSPNDQIKFATYTRDSATLLDYANNRYYSNAYGRFMSPDPYTNSGRLTDPQSWNRYAYTRGDPVNRADPMGSDDCDPNTCVTVTASYDNLDYMTFSQYGGDGYITAAEIAAAVSAAEAAAASYAATYAPPGPYNYTNAGQDQAKTSVIGKDMSTLESRLQNDPDCLNWLSTGGNYQGLGFLDGLLPTLNVTEGTISNSNGTITTVAAVANPYAGVNVFVNAGGAFFYGGAVPSANGSIPTIQANSTSGQLLILLHELAHVNNTAGFAQSDSNATVNAGNNDQVWQHCQKTITGN